MGNLAETYQHIADILSFETSNKKLEKKLRNPAFNWDSLVIEGSKHLVLPAIYCRLKAKKLIHVLPNDLNIYLEEISIINRNRNTSIIKQVHKLSVLLNEHKIKHVLLKGAALLILGCYKDNAERMVGDIDILVEKSQLKQAFDLIKTNGYDQTYGFAYEKISHRHLDRLISSNELAAIELHGELLNKKYRALLDAKTVLDTQVLSNGVSVPNLFYLNKHQILGWQVNDKGHFYNSVNFKYLYDTISLKVYQDKSLISNLHNSKYCRSYFEIACLYLKELCFIEYNIPFSFRRFTHKTMMKSLPLRSVIRWLKSSFLYVSSRLYLIKSNKNYRKHLYCKIFLLDKR